MSKSLKKGMLSVLLANIISLFFSLLTNFILPRFLSVDSYSAIKTYQLYLIYIGVLHFGYEDGMYLKYGGKNINELDSKDVGTNLYTLRIFQFLVSAIMLLIALVLKDKIFLVFSFAILPVNLIAYFKLLFQAIGEFGKYGRIMNLSSIITFIINMFFVFVIDTDNYMFFLCAYVIWDILLWIGLEIFIRKRLPDMVSYKQVSIQELKKNIRMGLPLTLGNFSSVLLTSIDRWFVKFTMNTVAFAQYSFAVSTESFVNTAVTPIIVTLYNYFCKHDDEEDIKCMRNSVMIFAALVVSCAFGAKFIVEIFLKDYMGAMNVLFFLFASQIFYVVIKGIYVNMYKAQKRQSEYFKKLILVVLFGIVGNVVCYAIWKAKEAYALATLGSAIVWLFLCIKDFPQLKLNLKEWLFFGMVTVMFLVCGIYMNAILGFIIYMVSVVLLAYILVREEFIYLIKLGMNMLPIKKTKGK